MKILCNFARVILNNVTFKTINTDLTALPKHNKLIIKTINFLFTFNNYFIMKYFKLKFLLLFAALAVALPPAWAEEVTICNGDNTNWNVPLYGGGYQAQTVQLIYPATDLADVANNNITGIKFYSTSSLNFLSTGKFNVQIGETSLTSYSSGSDLITANLTQVVTGQTPTAGISEFAIDFDEPYTYEGGNLVIEIDVTDPLYVRYTSVYFSGANQEAITALYGTSYIYTQKFLPKATIYFEPNVLDPYKAKVTPEAIDFGKTIPGAALTQEIYVTNKGENSFTPMVTGLSAPFSTTYTPVEIAYGETATIPITFTPNETGSFTSTVQVIDNGGNITPVSISLTGSCVNEVTICEGDATNEKIPFYGNYNDVTGTISQMIYPASKLTSLDGKTITGLTFFTDNNGILFSGGATTVTMGFIDQVEYSNDAPFTIDGTTATTTITPVAGGTEISITFENGLEYTAGKNLIIQTEVTTGGSYKTTTFVGETQSYNCAYNNKTYYGATVPFLPKVTFTYQGGGETPVEPDPVLVVDPDELDLDEATTFTVMGENLKGDVTITVDNANFTVTPATITKADAEEGATVTVAYTGTNTDGEIATITVASQGAESATVTVMGAAPKPVTVEKPVFDPEDGTTFEKNLTVTLTCATTGATIQYSYNNEYFTNYTEPIVIDETTTIYAKAVLGEVESEVVSATYTKEAAPGIITDFKETFTDCDGTGGNDGSWSGNIASSAFSDSKADNAGWALVSGNAANACIKIGTGSKQGSATTPNIAVTPGITYTLTFNAGAWEGDQTTLNISATGGNLSQSTVTLNSGSWNNYTLTFTATDEIATITFSGVQASKARFFLDEIVLSHEASAQPTQVVATPTFNPAQGEYTEAQNVTITCATEDAVIHFTVDGTDPTAESPVYAEAIAVGETTTIKAIAMKEGMTNSEIATATYTINIPSGETTTFVKVTDADQLVAGNLCGESRLESESLELLVE